MSVTQFKYLSNYDPAKSEHKRELMKYAGALLDCCGRCHYGRNPSRFCSVQLCPVFERITEIRPLLRGGAHSRQVDEILKKGASMLSDELRFLIFESVDIFVIRDALGLSSKQMLVRLKNIAAKH